VFDNTTMKETLRLNDGKSVESSLGWKIDILSIDSFQYAESDKTMKFEIEDYPDERGDMEWLIYLPAEWRWGNSFDNEPVMPEKISEIINRIELAFWKLDMTIKEMA
jgi:hypothetical protein